MFVLRYSNLRSERDRSIIIALSISLIAWFLSIAVSPFLKPPNPSAESLVPSARGYSYPQSCIALSSWIAEALVSELILAWACSARRPGINTSKRLVLLISAAVEPSLKFAAFAPSAFITTSVPIFPLETIVKRCLSLGLALPIILARYALWSGFIGLRRSSLGLLLNPLLYIS